MEGVDLAHDCGALHTVGVSLKSCFSHQAHWSLVIGSVEGTKGEEGAVSACKSSFCRCGEKLEIHEMLIIQIIKMHQRRSV